MWLYNAAGKSVVAAALYHTMLNLCWQLFPNRGSHDDPRVTGVVTAILGLVILTRQPKDPQGPVRGVFRDGEDPSAAASG